MEKREAGERGGGGVPKIDEEEDEWGKGRQPPSLSQSAEITNLRILWPSYPIIVLIDQPSMGYMGIPVSKSNQ